MKILFDREKSGPSQHERFTDCWVALSIGNTHWRWGYFEGETLSRDWTTPPTSWEPDAQFPTNWQRWCTRSPALQWHEQQGRSPFPPLYLASVVEAEQQLWLDYTQAQSLALADIPMKGLYDSLGIDRALAVLGAGETYGWPVLVIDGGTALTFSGADATGFKGGAIAPGLGLQISSLTDRTAALPKIEMPPNLPSRLGDSTKAAIQSGIIHGVLDTIIGFSQQWCDLYPSSHILFTGGDGEVLLTFLREKLALTTLETSLRHSQYDPHLIFTGMSHCLRTNQ